MKREELATFLEHPNVGAWLKLIRACEGTADNEGYRRLFGGSLFDSFADHPRRAVSARLGGKTIASTAAGAYQILARTWDELVRRWGFPDFTPACQDEAAVALILRRKAMDDVLAGRFDQALEKLSWEWASLPPGRYGQPIKSKQDCLKIYLSAGGTLGPEQAPAPVEERNMSPLLIPAALEIAKTIPDLMRLFKAKPEEAQVAEKLVSAASQAVEVVRGVEKPPLEAVVEAVKNDPQVKKMLEAALRNDADLWTRMKEAQDFDEASRQAARDFALRWNRPVLGKLGFVELLSLVLVLISSAGGGWVLYGEFPPEMKGAVVTLMLVGGFTAVVQYWLGSSFGSKLKDER